MKERWLKESNSNELGIDGFKQRAEHFNWSYKNKYQGADENDNQMMEHWKRWTLMYVYQNRPDTKESRTILLSWAAMNDFNTVVTSDKRIHCLYSLQLSKQSWYQMIITIDSWFNHERRLCSVIHKQSTIFLMGLGWSDRSANGRASDEIPYFKILGLNNISSKEKADIKRKCSEHSSLRARTLHYRGNRN
jgi:hypothetical protein